MGNPDATQEELDDAIESAHLQEMIADFSEQLNTTLYNATIRNGIAVEEAALNQIPLCDYVKKNNNKPYIDYRGFVTETLKRLERDNNGN